MGLHESPDPWSLDLKSMRESGALLVLVLVNNVVYAQTLIVIRELDKKENN
ncbi:hypothetical protein K435DRAFT_880590 [Dendrothele bispora CBS 962.96]|uniref:Uncharacterized protein n=1 Tax=Dendrothele bispora (strain CBS 962.96) TaxID=1314807 RepID=A0A4V4HAI0_DENBC|nr:hypothetical protein K435DRAFT_880590 [Dendrothele bispora CBS 962.96]